MLRANTMFAFALVAAAAFGCGSESQDGLGTEASDLDSRVMQWNSAAGEKTYYVSTISDEGSYGGEQLTIDLHGNADVPVVGTGPTQAATYSFHFVRLAEENPANTPVQEAVTALRLPEFPGTPTVGASYTWISGPITTDPTVLQMRTNNTVTITRVVGSLIDYEVVSKYQITPNAAWTQFKQTHLASKPVDWVTSSWTIFEVTRGTFDRTRGILVQSTADSIWPSFPGATKSSVTSDPDRRIQSVQLVSG